MELKALLEHKDFYPQANTQRPSVGYVLTHGARDTKTESVPITPG